MRSMTKSPLSVAQEALAAAEKALPEYSCAQSRRDYTQHQLFAILVLQKFFKLDYRGVVALLQEWSDARQLLGLKKIPHHTTLFYAHNRMAKRGLLTD